MTRSGESVGQPRTVILQDAYDRAQRFLDTVVRPRHEAELVVASCVELEQAWVFGYNARAFLDGTDPLASLAGNGPVVVPRAGAAPFLASSAVPVEDQVAEL